MTPDDNKVAPRPARDHERDVFSIPNVITVLRLVLIPVFYWFLVFQAPAKGQRNDIAFVLFFITAGTDWLDGWLARRTGTVTAIGKIIDPLVDRLLIASALIGLYFTHQVRLLLVMLLIGRDVYLLYGAWVLERHHARRIPVTMLGKTTTFVLMGGFASLIWRYPLVHVPVLGVFDLGRPRVCTEDELALQLRLAGAELDGKVEALLRQVSQTGGLIAAVGLERFSAWVATESFARPLATR
jgi:CDP-diacylglycerol--glycerol-3-phosphate 3-phosphatidyltransferase